MFQSLRAGGYMPTSTSYGSPSLSYPAQNLAGYYEQLSAQAAAAPVAQASTAYVAQSASLPISYDSGKLRIAVIDNFNPDSDPVFHGAGSHGAYVTQLIQSGGSDPRLAGQIDVMTYDAGQPGAGAETTSTSRILDALNDVYVRAANGERIDAVNLSQAAFGEGTDYPKIREAIERLRSINIPVSIAAGNEGPQNENQLATASEFEVEALQNGIRKTDSGLGNIQAEGEYTSYAAANLAPLLAARHAAGMSIAQIKQEAVANNNMLPANGLIGNSGPAYTVPTTGYDAYAATQPISSDSNDMMNQLMSMFMMIVAYLLNDNSGYGQSAANTANVQQQTALQQQSGLTLPQQLILQQQANTSATPQQPVATQRIA